MGIPLEAEDKTGYNPWKAIQNTMNLKASKEPPQVENIRALLKTSPPGAIDPRNQMKPAAKKKSKLKDGAKKTKTKAKKKDPPPMMRLGAGVAGWWWGGGPMSTPTHHTKDLLAVS
jgi:hypothetical protein